MRQSNRPLPSPNAPERAPRVGIGRSRRLGALIVALILAVTGSTVAGGQSSVSEARKEREAIRSQRAAAAAELDAAKADDAEVAEALAAINASVAAQELALEDAQRQLAVANEVAAEAAAQVLEAEGQIARLRDQLNSRAVDGFLIGNRDDAPDFLTGDDLNAIVRQNTLMQLANADAVDLLEEMRSVQEDRDVAQAIADHALEQAQILEAQMAAILTELEGQRAVQAALKAEMEARVATWQGELASYEAEEARLSEFIRAEEAKLAAAAPASGASPGAVSGAGMQWPIVAPVSSGFGWRIHPIYGTRRLHQGIDLGAATGTPIHAAAGGTVIAAGTQGGYGTTVVIAHGNGISTLYAHQSRLAVANGATVSRGQVIGYVGSTGASTGPHLHFEVRVNGTAVDPRGYLP